MKISPFTATAAVLAAILVGFGGINWRRGSALERERDDLVADVAMTQRRIAELNQAIAAQTAAHERAAAGDAEQRRQKAEALSARRQQLHELEEKLRAVETPRAVTTGPEEKRAGAALANAGRATASSAVETLFWALNNGEPREIADSLLFHPTLKQKAQALFDQLSAEQRARYQSPEQLVGFLLSAGTPVESMQVLEKTIEKGDRQATVRLQIGFADGATAQPEITLVRADRTWQWVVPDALVDKFAKILDGRFAVNAGNPLPK